MGNCSAGCKKEFKKSNFTLTHEHPDRLVRAQWDNCTGCGMLYVMWRLLAVCGMVSIFVYGYLAYVSNWFVYYTTWALLMVMLDVIVQGLVSIAGYRKYKGQWGKTFPHMPWYLKMSWLFNNVATGSTLTVSVAYWAFVAPIQIAFGGGVNIYDILLHGVTGIYVIVNLFITAAPVRIYHLYHTFLFNIVYLVFAAVYQLGFKQPYVPYTLNWDYTTNAVRDAAIVYIGVSTGVWLVYYGLYRIRKGIYNCTDGTNRQQEATERITYDRKHQSLGVSASVPVRGHQTSGGFSGSNGYSSHNTGPARSVDTNPRRTPRGPPAKNLNQVGPDIVNVEPSYVVLSNMPRNPNE